MSANREQFEGYNQDQLDLEFLLFFEKILASDISLDIAVKNRALLSNSNTEKTTHEYLSIARILGVFNELGEIDPEKAEKYKIGIAPSNENRINTAAIARYNINEDQLKPLSLQERIILASALFHAQSLVMEKNIDIREKVMGETDVKLIKKQEEILEKTPHRVLARLTNFRMTSPDALKPSHDFAKSIEDLLTQFKEKNSSTFSTTEQEINDILIKEEDGLKPSILEARTKAEYDSLPDKIKNGLNQLIAVQKKAEEELIPSLKKHLFDDPGEQLLLPAFQESALIANPQKPHLRRPKYTVAGIQDSRYKFDKIEDLKYELEKIDAGNLKNVSHSNRLGGSLKAILPEETVNLLPPSLILKCEAILFVMNTNSVEKSIKTLDEIIVSLGLDKEESAYFWNQNRSFNENLIQRIHPQIKELFSKALKNELELIDKFETALKDLKTATKKEDNNPEMRQIGQQLSNRIENAQKEKKITTNDLPLLIQSVKDSTNLINDPISSENFNNSIKSTQKISKIGGFSRNETLKAVGKLGLALLGTAIISASIAFAVATMFIGTPLSVAGVAIGTFLTVAAASSIAGHELNLFSPLKNRKSDIAHNAEDLLEHAKKIKPGN